LLGDRRQTDRSDPAPVGIAAVGIAAAPLRHEPDDQYAGRPVRRTTYARVLGGPVGSVAVQIVAALYIEDIQLRPVPGPSTRIDLTGAHFSMASPGPVPVTLTPHLVVIVRCPPDHPGTGALEVVYRRGDDQIARNVQPLQVEPGKFNYRLVRAELEFEHYDTVEAHCRIDLGPATVVPFTLLPPIDPPTEAPS
jgi:hypothetical protein